MDLDVAQLEQYAAELAQLDGVRSVVLDPAALVTPGVWMQLRSFALDTLDRGSWQIDLNLVLVVDNVAPVDAIRALAELLNTIRPALGNPAGPFTARTHITASGAALPALDIPVAVRLTQEN